MAYVILISDVIVGKKECMFLAVLGLAKKSVSDLKRRLLVEADKLVQTILEFFEQIHIEKRSVNPQKWLFGFALRKIWMDSIAQNPGLSEWLTWLLHRRPDFESRKKSGSFGGLEYLCKPTLTLVDLNIFWQVKVVCRFVLHWKTRPWFGLRASCVGASCL